MSANSSNVELFLELCRKQFQTGDIDADHPLFLDMILMHDLDPEEGLWLTILYMAFYNEGSAWAAFMESKPMEIPPTLWPVERNRRNLYGGRVVKHLESLIDNARPYGSLEAWLTHDFDDDPEMNWRRVTETYRKVWGNGRWSCYTFVDMLQKINKLKIWPPDIDYVGATGPYEGVMNLFGVVNDEVVNALFERVKAEVGGTYYIDTVDMAMMESVLCNWSAICKGDYYSGRNIDRMQERTYKVQDTHGIRLTDVWISRVHSFDHRHLGEYHGWDGIDKDRLKLFARTGELPWAHELRK